MVLIGNSRFELATKKGTIWQTSEGICCGTLLMDLLAFPLWTCRWKKVLKGEVSSGIDRATTFWRLSFWQFLEAHGLTIYTWKRNFFENVFTLSQKHVVRYNIVPIVAFNIKIFLMLLEKFNKRHSDLFLHSMVIHNLS